jgi:hypothetical protein
MVREAESRIGFPAPFTALVHCAARLGNVCAFITAGGFHLPVSAGFRLSGTEPTSTARSAILPHAALFFQLQPFSKPGTAPV